MELELNQKVGHCHTGTCIDPQAPSKHRNMAHNWVIPSLSWYRRIAHHPLWMSIFALSSLPSHEKTRLDEWLLRGGIPPRADNYSYIFLKIALLGVEEWDMPPTLIQKKKSIGEFLIQEVRLRSQKSQRGSFRCIGLEAMQIFCVAPLFGVLNFIPPDDLFPL